MKYGTFLFLNRTTSGTATLSNRTQLRRRDWCASATPTTAGTTLRGEMPSSSAVKSNKIALLDRPCCCSISTSSSATLVRTCFGLNEAGDQHAMRLESLVSVIPRRPSIFQVSKGHKIRSGGNYELVAFTARTPSRDTLQRLLLQQYCTY